MEARRHPDPPRDENAPCRARAGESQAAPGRCPWAKHGLADTFAVW